MKPSPKVKNTAKKGWPNPAVVIWDEFNLETLNQSYGHVLDFPIPDGWSTPRLARLTRRPWA